MEKTNYTTESQVETIAVLPRTLTIKAEQMQLAATNATMYVVYGLDPAQRTIWCATFIDEQEAEAWVHGSKVFGRPVTGAVLAGQGNVVQGGEMSDEATAVAGGDADPEQAGKPN